MTSAPILTSFSLMVVSDQCSTSLGNARVRMKLARLAVTGRGHGAADVGAAVDAAGGYRPAAPPLNGTAWPGRMTAARVQKAALMAESGDGRRSHGPRRRPSPHRSGAPARNHRRAGGRAGYQGGRAPRARSPGGKAENRSEEHTSELQSLMCISYAVFCLKKKNTRK